MGPHGKDQKITKDKTNIGYPKINRACPPFTPNCTPTDWKFYLELQYIIFRWRQENIGSRDGFVPLGNKSFPGEMLTKSYVATAWCHQAKMS